MAKKKLDKEAESTPSSPSKIVAVCKNETVHFVIGLMLVIFSVYLLLAFSSFSFFSRFRKLNAKSLRNQITVRALIYIKKQIAVINRIIHTPGTPTCDDGV